MKYSIGLDFGTNSCRALIADISTGNELATSVFPYPSGEAGIILNQDDPNLARQNPEDYLLAVEWTIKEAIQKAKEADKNFSTDKIIGIGVDTTGSSPVPVDSDGIPLCFNKKFKDNPAAMVWLWKDHTGYEEADRITRLAAQEHPEYLKKIGGVYSSEWFWSKIIHCEKEAPEVFNEVYSYMEICDWIPAVLVGDTKPENIKRSVCAAGHKAMYNSQWGGLPSADFLQKLSPGAGKLRKRMNFIAYPAEERMGYLSKQWAEKLGLSENVSVAVGAFDAHMGAVGAGIKTGTLVKILGTSTCDIMVSPNNNELADIPGVCGIVNESVMKGYFGIEAGQSAVGDIFLWFINNLVPEKYGAAQDEKFLNLERSASSLRPGETGLLALDWNNGNRTVLVDVRLTGLLIGQTLQTQPHEIYRALIEATAFGALKIIDRIAENGVAIEEVINCGGLAARSSLIMQIYADITGRPMKISRSAQTPALGAAIFGAVSAGKEAGGFENVEQAQKVMTGTAKVYLPDEKNNLVYIKIYSIYKMLHDAFGTKHWDGNLYSVMKDLLVIRDKVRKSNVQSPKYEVKIT